MEGESSGNGLSYLLIFILVAGMIGLIYYGNAKFKDNNNEIDNLRNQLSQVQQQVIVINNTGDTTQLEEYNRNIQYLNYRIAELENQTSKEVTRVIHHHSTIIVPPVGGAS